MVTQSIPAETRTLLQNITWETFKTMLVEMGSDCNTRLSYNSGLLEMMTPLIPHENSNRIIEGFVVVLCEELELEYRRG